MKASVIVCSRNPRPEWLARLGEALVRQDADPADWECVVVDNGSEPPIDLPVFPPARLVREEEPGLTPARLRGIRESQGDVLIFFDDDNIPDPTYVSAAIGLFGSSKLGVAGGRIDGEFAGPIPKWAQPYMGWLAIRPGVVDNVVAGLGDPWSRLPCGAGFCIRADAARRYADEVAGDARRLGLGRRGGALGGSEDTDMALTALDMGYVALLTPLLRLVHVMPDSRLEAGYLERLLEGSTFSNVRLALMRGIRLKPFWLNRLLRRVKRCRTVSPAVLSLRLRMERAIDRGEAAARADFTGFKGSKGI